MMGPLEKTRWWSYFSFLYDAFFVLSFAIRDGDVYSSNLIPFLP